MKTKIITVIGARPQFIKAAVLSRHIRENPDSGIEEVIVHTGQHYDNNMSQVFFDELEIPRPKYNLDVGSASHGLQTGVLLEKLEPVIVSEQPDWVLVYGDTNSTLAGALTAGKLHIPVGHVEAGLRSWNRKMPEEINRVLTDHLSSALFCPTETAIKNLKNEGIPNSHANNHLVQSGDVMYDAVLFYAEKQLKTDLFSKFKINPGEYILATVHRAETTDSIELLAGVIQALIEISQNFLPVVFPVHPRTKAVIQKEPLLQNLLKRAGSHFIATEPLSYLEMIHLEKNSHLIATDSGGVQKEAYFFKIPCVTMRTETEWVELVNSGWNEVAGLNPQKIVSAVENQSKFNRLNRPWPSFFGSGKAGETIFHFFKDISG